LDLLLFGQKVVGAKPTATSLVTKKPTAFAKRRNILTRAIDVVVMRMVASSAFRT
jgi:hypothetical protein